MARGIPSGFAFRNEPVGQRILAGQVEPDQTDRHPDGLFLARILYNARMQVLRHGLMGQKRDDLGADTFGTEQSQIWTPWRRRSFNPRSATSIRDSSSGV